MLIPVLAIASLFHDQIAFELATEIDRQHGEESLKRKIDVLPGMTMICAVMPTFAVKNCRSWQHSCVVRMSCGCPEDSGDPAPLSAA